MLLRVPFKYLTAMVHITNEHWKKISFIFEYLINQESILECPHCKMPYKNGFICENCGSDPSVDDSNEFIYNDENEVKID